MQYASLSVTTLSTVSAHMQLSVLTRLSGHTVHPDKVCLTVSCVYTHPVQGLVSPRTLDYKFLGGSPQPKLVLYMIPHEVSCWTSQR